MALRDRLEHMLREAEYDHSKGREHLREQWERHFWLYIDNSEYRAWRKANPMADDTNWYKDKRQT